MPSAKPNLFDLPKREKGDEDERFIS